MLPAPVDLIAPQAADFYYAFTWKRRPSPGAAPVPVDLTGYTFRAQLLIHGAPVLTLDSDPDADRDGTITADSDGVIRLEALGPLRRHGRGDWALNFTDPDGHTDVLVEGRVYVTKQATAAAA